MGKHTTFPSAKWEMVSSFFVAPQCFNPGRRIRHVRPSLCTLLYHALECILVIYGRGVSSQIHLPGQQARQQQSVGMKESRSCQRLNDWPQHLIHFYQSLRQPVQIFDPSALILDGCLGIPSGNPASLCIGKFLPI